MVAMTKALESVVARVMRVRVTARPDWSARFEEESFLWRVKFVEEKFHRSLAFSISVSIQTPSSGPPSPSPLVSPGENSSSIFISIQTHFCLLLLILLSPPLSPSRNREEEERRGGRALSIIHS
ncbi:hypothetical protein F7725_020038 [Dissostichus mawsoni]|uniref:Uncharacterized protein n=1 Tax=Dissostichus mawsoni TaxID=36200 RepID=A0A7J5YNI9_DISMA|nr:hypothetical protein F7725_020038 [Dissostichus mawsoni]